MNVNKPTGPTYVNPYQKVQGVQKIEKSKPANNQDQVEISSEAKKLLEDQVTQERQEKIEQLKKQIENGEYTVNTKELAERFFTRWFK